MSLGRRQIDVLLAAMTGKSRLFHVRRGRFCVTGLSGEYGDEMFERLADLGLITTEETDRVSSFKVLLTKEGESAVEGFLRTMESESGPAQLTYPP